MSLKTQSLALLCTVACASPAFGSSPRDEAAVISRERQHRLIDLVRQECGSCHGLKLTGGLGPPLTPSSLARQSPQRVAQAILQGRPGTAMPAWQAILDEDDAAWIAQHLQAGFPAGGQAAP